MIQGWRERLIDAVDRDGRSDRAISKAAKLGPNFMNELRNTTKEPGVDKVLRLAEVLNVSVGYLFMGADLSPEDEEFVSLLRSSSREERLHLTGLLRSRRVAAKQ
jgi:transcriptional regulator with XRE-family HTH domain